MKPEEALEIFKQVATVLDDAVIDLLGVCDATLWHWARSGYLVPVKLGRRANWWNL